MADIETIELDGLNFAEVAAPSTPSAASVIVYAKSDGKLYIKDDAGTETDLTAGASGASNLASGRVVLSSGDLTTTSGTFVDATGLSITITTGARRVLLGFTAQVYNNNTAGAVFLTFAVDGTDQGDTSFGLTGIAQHATATEGLNGSFTYLTDVLTAGSHTFKVRFHRGSSGTATIAASTPDAHFYAVELYTG